MQQGLKLSIAIPTYNRVRFLKDNLINLIFQLECLNEKIEIVVSDNASSDDTEMMVAELIATGAPILYFKNESNVGMDRNADLAVRRCSGEYVLLMGDDDFLELDSLKEILTCLVDYPNVGIIYSNFRVYDADLVREINIRDHAFDAIEKNTYYEDGLEVLKNTKKIFAAITGGVYKRVLWDQAHPQGFFDSIFIHVGVTLYIMCNIRAPAYIFKQPLFKYRLNDNTKGKIKSFQDIFSVSFGLLGILKKNKRYLPSPVFQQMYIKELQWTRAKILGAKARESVPIFQTMRQMKECYDTSQVSFWLIDLPLLWIPSWILKVPYQTYRVIKYRKG